MFTFQLVIYVPLNGSNFESNEDIGYLKVRVWVEISHALSNHIYIYIPVRNHLHQLISTTHTGGYAGLYLILVLSLVSGQQFLFYLLLPLLFLLIVQNNFQLLKMITIVQRIVQSITKNWQGYS